MHFGAACLLLVLPHSTVNAYSSSFSFSTRVAHRKQLTRGTMLGTWCAQSWLLRLCFKDFSGRLWRTDLPFEPSYCTPSQPVPVRWDMPHNYLWLCVIEKVMKVRWLIFSEMADISGSRFSLPWAIFFSCDWLCSSWLTSENLFCWLGVRYCSFQMLLVFTLQSILIYKLEFSVSILYLTLKFETVNFNIHV